MWKIQYWAKYFSVEYNCAKKNKWIITKTPKEKRKTSRTLFLQMKKKNVPQKKKSFHSRYMRSQPPFFRRKFNTRLFIISARVSKYYRIFHVRARACAIQKNSEQKKKGSRLHRQFSLKTPISSHSRARPSLSLFFPFFIEPRKKKENCARATYVDGRVVAAGARARAKTSLSLSLSLASSPSLLPSFPLSLSLSLSRRGDTHIYISACRADRL